MAPDVEFGRSDKLSSFITEVGRGALFSMLACKNLKLFDESRFGFDRSPHHDSSFQNESTKLLAVTWRRISS